MALHPLFQQLADIASGDLIARTMSNQIEVVCPACCGSGKEDIFSGNNVREQRCGRCFGQKRIKVKANE